jgi:iron complex outermembrane receptor protein
MSLEQLASLNEMGESGRSTARRAAALAAAIAAVIAAAPARAQDAGAMELGEIVVTARQRAEKLTDVPATVQAFTAAEIKAAGIERPADFIALTSGLSQVQTVEVGDMQVNIRGINSGRDTESSFALVVDGVLLTNPNVLNQELDGVTQIEVLKGPQGALYGRNALAGALIMTTRKPGDSLEAHVKAGYGNYNTWNGSFSLSGPISDTIGGTLSAYTKRSDGSFKNSLTGCDDCENFQKDTGVSGRLVFNLGDNAEIDVKARYSKVDAGGVTFNASLALVDTANFFGSLGVPNADKFWEDPNEHEFVYINNVPPQNKQRNKNFSVVGRFDTAVGTLTATASYNDAKNYFLVSGTSNAFGIYNANPVCQQSYAAANGTIPLPPPFFYAGAPGTFDQIGASFLPPYPPITCGGYQYQQRDQKDGAIELRLTSPGDQRLRWMLGTYFAQIKRRLVVAYGGDLGTGVFNKGFVPSTGPNPTDLLYDDDLKSKVYAGFANVAYDIADNVELAAALRYDIEDRSVDNNVPKINPQTPGFGAFGSPVCPNPASCTYYINPFYNQNPAFDSIPNRSKTFKQLQPKATINWKPTEDFSVYASYGYGFRSGGFNSSGTNATLTQFFGNLVLDRGPFAGTPNLALQAPDFRDDRFRKEVSKAAELGFKSRLFDRRLSLNGAVYLTKVEDMQDFSFFAGPFGSLRVVTNIDKVDIKGVEFDFRWSINDYVTFSGGANYTDTEIKRYDVRPFTVGNKVAYVPKYTVNASLEFRAPIADGMRLVARIDESMLGKTWFSPVQNNVLPNFFTAFGFGEGDFSKQYRKSYATTNARIGIDADNWSVMVWGNNVFNKKFLAEIIPAPEFGGSFIHNYYGRTYGVNVTYSFGGAR